ncbi:MAG: hypothetical protein HYS18_03715 [Burkholderiales bacterium]|nr:hypothetical protein [Burkholderiales bacterium]
MLTRTLKIAAATIAFTAIASSTAHAQMYAPPMDMSWAMQSQMNNYAYGQAAANAAAMDYLRRMQQMRARGYTGPSLPTGVTNESLRNSINGANEAGMDYNRAQSRNSQRTSNAVDDYSHRAIRGCTLVRDYYGRVGYAC